MKNYRVQNACINCKYVFVKEILDSCDDYECRYGMGSEPQSPGADVDSSGLNVFWDAQDAWIFAGGPEVQAHGVCDEYVDTVEVSCR